MKPRPRTLEQIERDRLLHSFGRLPLGDRLKLLAIAEGMAEAASAQSFDGSAAEPTLGDTEGIACG